MRVLVVDDEACIRQLIRSVLAIKGYEALEAENGLEALEIARRFPCDLVITDQVMPGLDGLSLIARLTAERYPARYLLISGYISEDEEAGGLPFLSKPFTVLQLKEMIEKLIHQPALPELERRWRQAKAEWEDAISEMEGVIQDVPGQIPHPDGSLLIQKAGENRKAAFEKYIAALGKYKEALRQGGVLGRTPAEPQGPRN
jgi:two-component system, chemotaxis family, chemotaxis protein CheY